MIHTFTDSKPKKTLSTLVGFILLVNLVTLLNIPVLREILGIPFLIVLPGMLLLLLFKLNKLDLAEKCTLTVGLSIGFLMFFGIILNQICLGIGHDSPLSTETLVPSLSVVLILLSFAAYHRNRIAFNSFPYHTELNPTAKLILIPPALLLLVTVLGMRVLNTSGNNWILLLLLLDLIPISFVLITAYSGKISKNSYVIAIIMIAFSLLSISWLRSSHVLAHDVHTEYFLFHLTSLNEHWDSGYASLLHQSQVQLNSCISISILPAIFQSVMDVSWDENLFKGIYVIICTFTPLAIFIISRKYIGESYAFLATLFFMIQLGWMATAESPRTNVGIFFCAISLMVLFHDEIKGITRKGLFTFFLAAIVAAHYSTAFIFFFLLFIVLFMSFIFRKWVVTRRLTMIDVGLFAVMIFFWYDILAQETFQSAMYFIETTVDGLQNFFEEGGRDPEASKIAAQGLGGPLDYIRLFSTWAIFGIIGTGILGTLIKRKGMISTYGPLDSPGGLLQSKIETQYYFMALGCSAMLVAIIALPYVTEGYGMHRAYSLMAVILSIFFVLGSMIISKIVRINPSLIMLVILIPYFLFITGIVYEVFDKHNVWTISEEHPALQYELVYDQEIASTQWLKSTAPESSHVFPTDFFGALKLISQGKFPPRALGDIYVSEFDEEELKNGYIFLSHNNVVNNEIRIRGESHTVDEYAYLLDGKNRVYVNGGSEVWK